MEFRKTLLLSAAIPLMTLPLTLPTHAKAAERHATAGDIVVAQADPTGDQKDDKRKKHHGEKHGNGQNEGRNAEKPAAGDQQGQAKKKPEANGGQSAGQPPAKAAPSNDNASQTEQKQAPGQKQAPSGGADQKAAQPEPKKDQARHERKRQAEPKQAVQPDQGKQNSDASTAEGDHSKKRHSDRRAKEGSDQQNGETPKKPSAQEKAVKTEPAKPKQEDAAKPAATETKPAATEKSNAQATDKKAQPPKQDNAGDAATPKSTNEAAAPKKSEPDRQGDNAAKHRKGGSRQDAQKQPIPAEPEKNAAVPAAKGGQPERFKGANGAPVLDSAKEAAPADKQPNGAADTQGQAQTQDKAVSTSPDAGSKTTVTETRQPVTIQSAEKVKGQQVKEPPKFRLPQDAKVEKRTNNRVILNIDNRTVIENNDYGRIARHARDVRYETLSNGRTRQVVVRPNGVRIITIRNEYGDIVHRSRIDRDGHEIALIYTPDGDRRDRRFYRDPALDLPPIRLNEPVDEYVLEGRHADERQYVTFLEKPPIERVRQVYTLDQVRYSARLRDMMPRIDLDTVTFPSGSADIGPREAQSLQMLADAILSVLRKDPGQVFLVEGHTDAVGSAQSNLILSDERAESVASVLTQDFDVPPENLVTQGYGEQYLKVDTEGAERANRRVTVRRITPLVRPVAQK